MKANMFLFKFHLKSLCNVQLCMKGNSVQLYSEITHLFGSAQLLLLKLQFYCEPALIRHDVTTEAYSGNSSMLVKGLALIIL